MKTIEERLADRLARSERPDARLARVRAKQTDPATVAALRRLWAEKDVNPAPPARRRR